MTEEVINAENVGVEGKVLALVDLWIPTTTWDEVSGKEMEKQGGSISFLLTTVHEKS